MSLIDKNNVCEEFYNSFVNLTETKKNNFSRLCNKLLNDNYVYGCKADDKNDYYDILEMKSLIRNYFYMMDFDLIQIDTYKLFYIQTNSDRNRIRLKKLETIIVLVLRLLYYKGSLDVNSGSDISTTIGKIITEISQTGIFNYAISMTDYFNAFKLLKRYKLIDFSFSEMKEDNVIIIYPTILYIVKIESIDMLNNKIKSYEISKGENENETEED